MKRANALLVADTSLSGGRVARELDAVIRLCGKPQQNGFIESFNARLRDELLNEEEFDSFGAARKALAIWRHEHHNVRRHSALDRIPRIRILRKPS